MTRLDMTKNPGNVEPIQRVLLIVQIDASVRAINASVAAHNLCRESSVIGVIPGSTRYYPCQRRHREQETPHDKPISKPRIESQFVAQRNSQQPHSLRLAR